MCKRLSTASCKHRLEAHLEVVADGAPAAQVRLEQKVVAAAARIGAGVRAVMDTAMDKAMPRPEQAPMKKIHLRTPTSQTRAYDRIFLTIFYFAVATTPVSALRQPTTSKSMKSSPR